MGHNLRAIIAKSGVLTPVANAWIHAETIELTQGFSLIKVTDLLLDDINELINVKQNDPYDEFDDLTASELYDILKLRQDVFIIEQDCIYPDMDEADSKALHLFSQSEFLSNFE